MAQFRLRMPKLDLQSNVALSGYTTLMAGGPAKWLAEFDDVDALAEAAAEAQKLQLPYSTLGSGSNILPSDKGVPHLVFIDRCRKYYFGKTQYVECGSWFQDVFLQAAQQGLAGLEFAVGVPGTLGGALVSNAGAYRANIADFLTEVEIVREGVRKWVPKEQMEFSYRDSILRRPDPPSITLLAVKLCLEPGDPAQIYNRAKEYQRQRIGKQPPHPSAGSFFKNVVDHHVAERIPNLTEGMRAAGVVPAGYLIEACGLKGEAEGRATISGKHGNFICNLGGASASQIRRLAERVKKVVQDKFGVTLEEEVLYIGNWDAA
jgi:UDP-N-acetylmuramate dehydrogenase